MIDKQTQTKQLFTAVHKGAVMGEKAIDLLFQKSKDNALNQVLGSESERMAQISARANQCLTALGDPVTVSSFETFPLTAGINLQTLVDKGDSKFARIMIDGSTMGITQIHDSITQNPSADKEAVDLANELVALSTTVINDMQRFL